MELMMSKCGMCGGAGMPVATPHPEWDKCDSCGAYIEPNTMIDQSKPPLHIPTNGNLRDSFAMAALTGILAHRSDSGHTAAETAYRYADWMLEARKK